MFHNPKCAYYLPKIQQEQVQQNGGSDTASYVAEQILAPF